MIMIVVVDALRRTVGYGLIVKSEEQRSTWFVKGTSRLSAELVAVRSSLRVPCAFGRGDAGELRCRSVVLGSHL